MRIIGTRSLSLALLCALFIPATLQAASNDDTERLIRRITPPISVIKEAPEAKDTWYLECFYEPSRVLQGTRTGMWSEITETFGYNHKNINIYFSSSRLGRFDIIDYTGNLGLYLNFNDYYFHLESGFGWDVNFTYKFQNIAEYGHKLYKTVFWQIGYNYRDYNGPQDVHNVYPSIIYYFGNHSMSATYGESWIESRSPASFATFKGDFEITQFLRINGGVAVGTRLYDIYAIETSKEEGYIVFGGINLKLPKGINFRFGGSYGTEEPKFIKRSVNFDLQIKF